MRRICILGAGSWGTALAIALGQNDHGVKLWAREAEAVKQLNIERENSRYLKGCVIPRTVEATNDLEHALLNAEIVVVSVPSHAVRSVVAESRPYIPPDACVVSTAKGFELETLKCLSQVISEELPTSNRVVVLSGPSHAEEVGAGMPTAVVAAAEKRGAAEYVQSVFMSSRLRVYTNPDVLGVQIAGSLKNVIALATGMADGLGFGDNAKAALMTRGMAEIARLGVSMGAAHATFSGLAGIGDLIVTCTSMHSRNRRAGIQLGQGKKLEDVLREMGMVVEGVRMTKVAKRMAEENNVDMPITEQVHNVLFEGHDAADCVDKLMGRDKTPEVAHPQWGW